MIEVKIKNEEGKVVISSPNRRLSKKHNILYETFDYSRDNK